MKESALFPLKANHICQYRYHNVVTIFKPINTELLTTHKQNRWVAAYSNIEMLLVDVTVRLHARLAVRQTGRADLRGPVYTEENSSNNVSLNFNFKTQTSCLKTCLID